MCILHTAAASSSSPLLFFFHDVFLSFIFHTCHLRLLYFCRNSAGRLTHTRASDKAYNMTMTTLKHTTNCITYYMKRLSIMWICIPPICWRQTYTIVNITAVLLNWVPTRCTQTRLSFFSYSCQKYIIGNMCLWNWKARNLSE
jgi:hypothetical protein